MSTPIKTEDLVQLYKELWSTTDEARRHELASQLLSDHATVSIAQPQTLQIHGHADIETHIAFIHKDLVENGLRFRVLDNTIGRNNNAVKFSFQAVNGADEAVVNATVFLILDDENRVVSDHTFFG
ncbi:hypothetical protein ACFFSY_32780 [Paenibacillus aurantiacus]|uniref:Nuclear transport factor 2 family protein n=1 Tax=Paenibacillus aurantiacus TaxID=1936118 RepID=A0ABV5L382_9BACL